MQRFTSSTFELTSVTSGLVSTQNMWHCQWEHCCTAEPQRFLLGLQPFYLWIKQSFKIFTKHWPITCFKRNKRPKKRRVWEVSIDLLISNNHFTKPLVLFDLSFCFSKVKSLVTNETSSDQSSSVQYSEHMGVHVHIQLQSSSIMKMFLFSCRRQSEDVLHSGVCSTDGQKQTVSLHLL